MLACFSEEVQQRSMPLSLGIPARKRQEVEAVLPKLVQVVDNYGLDIQHIVHDVSRNKASVFAIASGDTPFGDFNNEYAVFLEFDDSGEKITRLDEMMDSVFLMKFFPSFKKYLAGH